MPQSPAKLTTYRGANLKTRDECDNRSGLSNVVEVEATAKPTRP